ncbi:mobilization protein [Calothrix sp. FACHB-1219]|uniref:mobilization protein n=1 Tax=unclassified Calothrix TaxID=2619626 RepID=UPI001688A0A3|nr:MULTISPECIES: mobilization protein [unclassified Calothrix]MBD2205648.1 mobilization protein [Calothrix sp. FACHB-168]MBD2220378.1 mobilization protein [Calothrix sp. FACHB-1219]
MAAIHFMDGEKGGVGKSLFARVMVQYCIDNKLSYELVEADKSNPDVGAFYPDNHKTAVFSESERKAYDADEIFNLALTTSVIVNLPAQVYPAVTDWIERNQILEITGKNKVKIYKWFVCSGGYDSVQLFMQSLERFENKIKHIFVRNYGLCDDWKHVDGRKNLQDLIKAHKVAVINFPKFSYRERDILDANQINFSAARDYGELGVLGKQRLHNFLKKASEEIDQAKIWNVPAASIISPTEKVDDANVNGKVATKK